MWSIMGLDHPTHPVRGGSSAYRDDFENGHTAFPMDRGKRVVTEEGRLPTQIDQILPNIYTAPARIVR